jgi:DNA-binding GntR family transcriptional regulator
MSLALPAGERLYIEDLAEKLGVSTMPIREALITLATEGLVQALPRRGFRVIKVEPSDAADVFRVHSMVAGLLAERAAESLSTDELSELRAIQNEIQAIAKRRMLAETRAQEIEELNFQFHRLINRAAPSPRLRWFLRAATRYIPRSLYGAMPIWTELTLHDHPAILDAIEERDAKGARALMEHHVLRAGDVVVARLEELNRLAAERTAMPGGAAPMAPV